MGWELPLGLCAVCSKFCHLFWIALEKLFRFLSSIELAVFVILSIAVSASIGTIFEAKYNAAIASTVVYRSWWFSSILGFFIINLFCAAMSRFPWKSHHIGFLVTHFGIITLIIGSIFTRYAGIDGQVILGVGETMKSIQTNDTYLTVFVSKIGSSYERVFHNRLEFHPRIKKKSWDLEMGTPQYSSEEKKEPVKMQLLRWYAKAERLLQVIPAKKEEAGVAALRFRIIGSKAKIEEWMFLNGKEGSKIDLGPAIVAFQKTKPALNTPVKKRTLFIYFDPKDTYPSLAQGEPSSKQLKFLGVADPNKVFPLHWMDFVFTLEEFHHRAIPKPEYRQLELTRQNALEVIQIEIGGKKTWLELGATAQLSLGPNIFYVQFSRENIPVPFALSLKDFHVDFYEGTSNAKSYRSIAQLNGEDRDITISMNEPLYYNGFTFYQSSYSTDQQGNPVFSVLSVNRDPGRWIKYMGSITMIVGILLMFYFKPMYSGKSKYFLKKKSA